LVKYYVVHIILFIAVLFINQLSAQDDDMVRFSVSDTVDILKLLRQSDDGGQNDDAILEALYMSRSMYYENGIKKALSILVRREIVRGNAVPALRYALEWQKILEKDQNSPELVKLYTAIGDIYKGEGIYDNAVNYYLKAEKSFSGNQVNPEVIRLWNLIGNTQLDNRHPEEAVPWLMKVKAYYDERQNSYADRIRILQQLSRAAELSGNFQQSLTYNIEIQNLGIRNNDQLTIALASNNLGYACHRLGKFKEAVAGFEDAERFALSHPGSMDLASIYVNLAIAWHNLRDPLKAISYLEKATEKNTGSIENSYIEHLAATIFLKKGDIYNALKYNDLALKEASASGQSTTLCDAYGTAADIYQQLFEYEKALEFYKKHLALKDSLLIKERAMRQVLENQQFLLEKTEKEIRLQLANQELQLSEFNRVNLQKDKLQLEKDKLLLDAARREKENEVLLRDKQVQLTSLKNAELQAQQARQALALTQQQLLATEQSQQIAELSQKERMAKLELDKQKADEARNQQQILLLQNQKKIDALELNKQRSFRTTAYGIGVLLGVILLLTGISWWYGKRLNRRLRDQNIEIEAQKQAIGQERNRAESLLLNVLPEETAQELKTTGKATPRKYEMVSVMFTDFTSFTRIAAYMPPEELIEVLNTCFTAFDDIADQYNLEKIKTIGDAYMCAGGLPKANTTNPVDAVSAAIAICNFMNGFNLKQKQAGKPVFTVRVGIHTGQVAAGVIGNKKFAYDIWGDTVNVASRLENNCPAGHINISESTYDLVKHRFDCTFRGKIAVKNKGEMGMYLVNG
jgi:adenylate cyclase